MCSVIMNLFGRRRQHTTLEQHSIMDALQCPRIRWQARVMRALILSILMVSFTAVLLKAEDDGLPAGKEKETFLKMCSNCHAMARVTKARFSKKFWSSVVDDMVSRGAEGTEEEAELVISYLSRHFGKPVNVNTATAKEIQEGLSFKAAEAELLVKHRTDNGAFKVFEDLLKIPGLNAKLLDEQKKNIQF